MNALTVSGRKFSLGQLVMTAGVNDKIADSTDFSKLVLRSIGRHAQGDWGDLCAEDKARNDADLIAGERLFSAYEHGELPKIWIITEWNRSVTTVLFPAEY